MKRLNDVYDWAFEQVRSTALIRDNEGAFDHGLWQQLCQRGLFESLVDGGKPKLQREFIQALFSLGAGSLDVPFVFTAVAHALGISLLLEYGTEKQKQKHLAKLLSGEMIGAICNAERGAGTDIRRIKSSCHVDGQSGVLNVAKGPVTNVPHAQLLFVSAVTHRVDHEPMPEIFLVEDRDHQFQSGGQHFAGMATGVNGWVNILEHRIDYAESRSAIVLCSDL